MRNFDLYITQDNVGDVVDQPLRLFTLRSGQAVTLTGTYYLEKLTSPCSAASLSAKLEYGPDDPDAVASPLPAFDQGQLGTYLIPALPVAELPVQQGLLGSFQCSLDGVGRDLDLFLNVTLLSGALDSSDFRIRVNVQVLQLETP